MLQATPTGNFLRAVVLSTVLPVTAVTNADTSGRSAEDDVAGKMLKTTGVKGGVIVHLGGGDGKLTAALRAGESYLVQGLDTDADNVRQAREYIRKLGVYGPVSVERFDGKRLPYAENLVNLVVAEDLGGVAMEEALRVLAPGGVLYAKQGGNWRKTVKPRPKDIDEWTHYLHDASGNAVAHDRVVGPPAHIQWIAGPRYTRSHEHIPGIYAVVSNGERIFYIIDEAPIASIRYTPQWRLVARDAFNGMLLWKQPIRDWYPHIVNWGRTPRQLQRKLVAVGDRVYVTLGIHAPLSALDAVTGETLEVYDKTRGTEEIVWHKGVLLLVVRSVTDERVAELEKWAKLVATEKSPVYVRETAEPLVRHLRMVQREAALSILALDAGSGRLLWKRAGPDVFTLKTNTLCAGGDRVFYQNGEDVVSLDLKTGRQRWSVSAPALRVVSGDSVFCAGGKWVTALSAESGKTQWTQPASLVDVRDLFVAGGSLWIGGFKTWQGRGPGKRRGPPWGPYFATQRDLATGKMLRHIEPENPGHHHRCYRNKATDRYILGGRRGTEFIDLKSGDVLWNSWARGVCRYGVMPCNGLLYAPPHACGCYMAAKLTGFNALAAQSKVESRESRAAERLEKGPAYDQARSPQPPTPSPTDWPTYRCDAQRSGATRSKISPKLQCRWKAKVGGRLTPLTVGDGKVFVASVDEHRVSAIDADSGKPIWNFTAGARVDSPPTLHRGRAIFGCRDGSVYALRMSDGALAWRLQAARGQRQIAAEGQFESVWPVHGSVLVRDNLAYFTAGRSSYVDGGIDLYRAEPATGKILSKTSIYSPDPKTGRQPKHFAPAFMAGARSDILSSDDKHVYLRDSVFDLQPKKQSEGNAHLFTLTDFLDDTWPHRSYWIFGKQLSISTGCSGRDKKLIYGRLLVFDESTIYGYGRANLHWSNQLRDAAYRLFAVKRGEGTPQWAKSFPIQVRAMVLADKVLFVAGPPVDAVNGTQGCDENEGALLVAVSASDGTRLAQYPLDALPVFDGMAAAGGRLYISLKNGCVVCMEEKGTSAASARAR